MTETVVEITYKGVKPASKSPRTSGRTRPAALKGERIATYFLQYWGATTHSLHAARWSGELGNALQNLGDKALQLTRLSPIRQIVFRFLPEAKRAAMAGSQCSYMNTVRLFPGATCSGRNLSSAVVRAPVAFPSTLRSLTRKTLPCIDSIGSNSRIRATPGERPRPGSTPSYKPATATLNSEEYGRSLNPEWYKMKG